MFGERGELSCTYHQGIYHGFLAVRGDNPLVKARGLSQVQVDNNSMTYISTNLAHYVIACAKKQVSMIRKYHNHTLQTNPRHREEEPHIYNYHKTPGIKTK